MNKNTVFDCHLLHLPRIERTSGTVTFASLGAGFPFRIRRVYHLYDIPGGAARGGHAHKQLEQLIVAVSGSFDVLLDDGRITTTINLNLPDYGLRIRPGIWRELVNFSSGAIVLAFASSPFDEDEYIRDYQEFIRFQANGRKTR